MIWYHRSDFYWYIAFRAKSLFAKKIFWTTEKIWIWDIFFSNVSQCLFFSLSPAACAPPPQFQRWQNRTLWKHRRGPGIRRYSDIFIETLFKYIPKWKLNQTKFKYLYKSKENINQNLNNLGLLDISKGWEQLVELRLSCGRGDPSNKDSEKWKWKYRTKKQWKWKYNFFKSGNMASILEVVDWRRFPRQWL